MNVECGKDNSVACSCISTDVLSSLFYAMRFPLAARFRVHSHLRFIRRKLSPELLAKNRLYCTKRVYSHLLFGRLLQGLKSSIMGYVPFSRLHGLKSSCNSLRLTNRRCEWTVSEVVSDLSRRKL